MISLDFELHWGVRDHHSVDGSYGANLRGARDSVVRTLELFEEFEVAATWATVGFLFASKASELERFSPDLKPAYSDATLFPYDEPLGEGEADDPLHFAGSLVERIRTAPRQEVGTHTYSHYFCGEAGQDAGTFAADLAAARAIAEKRGVELHSIVFPRNQWVPEYDPLLVAAGIHAYRGNPTSWMWRFRDARESRSPLRRAARLIDSYVPLAPSDSQSWDEVLQPSGLSNVRAGRMLRPWTPGGRKLEPLRLRRITKGLQAAAMRRRLYHLWWHPHNFGAHPTENLSALRLLLEQFRTLRTRHGMRSLTMSEVDQIARGSAGSGAGASNIRSARVI